jgi:hypothetical protein
MTCSAVTRSTWSDRKARKKLNLRYFVPLILIMDAPSIPDIGDINHDDRLTPGINANEPEPSGRADNDVNYHDTNRGFASTGCQQPLSVNASSTSGFVYIRTDPTGTEVSSCASGSVHVRTNCTGTEVNGDIGSQHDYVCYAASPLGVHSALRVDG